jgi:mannan endo-1,4-beta-mannosidase
MRFSYNVGAMKLALLFFCLLLPITIAIAQDSSFVQREGALLTLTGKPFYAVGANCYYLHDLAVQGDTAHLVEVLKAARELGFTTIRTWAFNDGTDSTNSAVMQFSPGHYNERALRALDYVVAKAKEYSLRLVLTFVDNWDYYGGMNQYVRWLNGNSLAKGPLQTENAVSSPTITSVGGRSYLIQPTSLYTHDDFYRIATIKQWYKNYVSMLLNRVNVYTGRTYKNEPAIILWELANEPRSSDPSGNLVAGWIQEMATFVKQLDRAHCVGTGEEGHDVQGIAYASSLFAAQQWMFNGSAGISFLKNIQLDAVDVASVHFYPEDWGFAPGAVIDWIQDHQRMALGQQKPLFIGEVGIRRQRVPFFDAVSSTAFSENASGLLFWQLAYAGQINLDGYQFFCPSSDPLCGLLSRTSSLFAQRRSSSYSPPGTVKLFSNYPNPFNYITAISFDIPSSSFVNLEVFDMLGRKLVSLVDERMPAGTHAVLFNASSASSGVYIARLRVGNNTLFQKLILLK